MWCQNCKSTKKQIDVSFFMRPVIDNEFRHGVVKVVWGSPANLTMFWRNLVIERPHNGVDTKEQL